MKRLKKLALLSLPVLVSAGWLLFSSWKQGTPFGPPYWSPNGRYYVQKHSNFTVSRLLPGMPGQASDSIDGYIRLYDREGQLLYERFETFIRDIEPVWARDKVYLLGVDEMDNDPWILPTPSE